MAILRLRGPKHSDLCINSMSTLGRAQIVADIVILRVFTGSFEIGANLPNIFKRRLPMSPDYVIIFSVLVLGLGIGFAAMHAVRKQRANGHPSYEPDDGPLTTKQIAALRKDAANHMPTGKVISREDLFK